VTLPVGSVNTGSTVAMAVDVDISPAALWPEQPLDRLGPHSRGVLAAAAMR